MSNKKVIFLLDMDAFFASCSIAKNNLPMDSIVGVASPNTRAIITSSSYKARELGIKAGMPVFQAKKISKDLIILPSDFKTYIDFSTKVFDIIYNNFSKKMEIASIDECYIDVTNEYKKFQTATKMAEAIKAKILKDLNVSCSIGISSNKFLAKTAVDFKKPYGTMVLLRENVPSILWPMKIEKMYGVGIATAELLKSNNILTIGELANTEVEFLEKLLGKNGYNLKLRALGIGDDDIVVSSNDYKSIGNEMTLEFKSSDEFELQEIIYSISQHISERMKKRFLEARTVAVVLRFERENQEKFDKRLHKKTVTRQETLSVSSNNLEDILATARSCFDYLWQGQPVVLIGVRVSNFISQVKGHKQISFEDVLNNKKTSKVEQLISDINFSLNSEIIITGSKLAKKQQKNISQSKFIKDDSVHLSNTNVKKEWKE
ncbi:DNA polymerase IV [Spiroplasma sabaudiense Ar-1343]|uniref:DNA polymerase IV n=1 Tax=Spiroplasma sabaudiense Ar-1343 TaxID=1276257 RepID=W6A9P6_9MOLU|nr:DNA polymerase IV [Spiroplasma sabaudiense]AHI53893.1 DNA polymerase IV [Spiroplasma sabaudiense Ar-1343]